VSSLRIIIRLYLTPTIKSVHGRVMEKFTLISLV
jgi:hypothetical protein